MSVVAGG
jgi:hypothetical protein